MSVSMCVCRDVYINADTCLHVCVHHSKKSRHFASMKSTEVSVLNQFQCWSPACSCIFKNMVGFFIHLSLDFIFGLAPWRNEMDVGKKKSQFQNCCFVYNIFIAFVDIVQILRFDFKNLFFSFSRKGTNL